MLLQVFVQLREWNREQSRGKFPKVVVSSLENSAKLKSNVNCGKSLCGTSKNLCGISQKQHKTNMSKIM
jgi:hypothetical protein